MVRISAANGEDLLDPPETQDTVTEPAVPDPKLGGTSCLHLRGHEILVHHPTDIHQHSALIYLSQRSY